METKEIEFEEIAAAFESERSTLQRFSAASAAAEEIRNKFGQGSSQYAEAKLALDVVRREVAKEHRR